MAKGMASKASNGGKLAASAMASSGFARERASEWEAERVWVNGEAAGRPPLHTGQRAAQSGPARHMASMRWTHSGLGRP